MIQIEWKDYSTIQRALGLLEGMASGIDNTLVTECVLNAVEMIDGALRKKDEDDNRDDA